MLVAMQAMHQPLKLEIGGGVISHPSRGFCRSLRLNAGRDITSNFRGTARPGGYEAPRCRCTPSAGLKSAHHLIHLIPPFPFFPRTHDLCYICFYLSCRFLLIYRQLSFPSRFSSPSTFVSMAFLPPNHFLALPRPDVLVRSPAGVVDTTTLAAHDWDVDTRTGFLPPDPPLVRLPSQWEPWEKLLDDAQLHRLQLGSKLDLPDEEKARSESWRARVSQVRGRLSPSSGTL
jgi:hypothetical protein